MSLLAALMLCASVAFAPPASADLLDTPARTWGTNGRVNTILPVGDRIYVGGTFTAVTDPSGISYPVSNLAVFSAATGAADLSFQATTDGAVLALATNGASLYIGGAFGNVTNGATARKRQRIAALDPGTGQVQTWAPQVTGSQVDALAYSAATGSLYLGGNFATVTGADGSSAPKPFIAKVNATSGAVDTEFQTAPADRVRALNVARDGSGRLFIGGDFLNVNGANRTKSLAAVSLSTGVHDASFVPGPTNQDASPPVFDITSDATRVFVATGGAGGACAALKSAGGSTLWSAHANGNMQSVRLVAGSLYCGGHFGGTGGFAGETRYKLAAVDASTGSTLAFSPRVNTSLGTWSLGAQAGDPNLYLGGDFTQVSGVGQAHYAQFVDSSLRQAPQPPANLTGQPGDKVAYLSWSVPSSDGGASIASYKLYRSLSPGGGLGTLVATLSSATTTYADTAVANGTTYHYEITALNRLGSSEASNEVAVTPEAGVQIRVPGAPELVTATNPPGAVHLDWNPPADSGGAPVTSYNIYRARTPGGQGSTPLVTGVTATSFDDRSGLVAGTTYYYRVTAVNSAGEGARSAEVSAVVIAGVPGDIQLSGTVSGNVVTLSWTTPPDGGSPILKYVLLKNSVKLDGSISPSQTTYTTTLATGETAMYQVKAVNAEGSGPLSNKVTLTSTGGTGGNSDPVAVDDTATVAEDSTANSIDVLANDHDGVDTGETLTVTAAGPARDGTVGFTATGVTYTPAANFSGSDRFSYTISDGNGGSATATVVVTVINVNDDPVAVDDSVSVAKNSTANSIDVLANDHDGVDTGETLTVTAAGPATHGTVGFTATRVTYTPDADYAGSDSFTYTISDGNGGSATATVKVNVKRGGKKHP